MTKPVEEEAIRTQQHDLVDYEGQPEAANLPERADICQDPDGT